MNCKWCGEEIDHNYVDFCDAYCRMDYLDTEADNLRDYPITPTEETENECIN